MTHGITYLPQCSKIIVMSGGKISEVGSYSQLIKAEGAFAEFIRQFSRMGEEEGEESGDDGPSELHTSFLPKVGGYIILTAFNLYYYAYVHMCFIVAVYKGYLEMNNRGTVLECN